MRTDTQTLIKSLLILSEEIESDDGVANAAIHEAALRMEELVQMINEKDNNIQYLEDLKADQVQEHAEEMLKIIEERDELWLKFHSLLNRLATAREMVDECIADSSVRHRLKGLLTIPENDAGQSLPYSG